MRYVIAMMVGVVLTLLFTVFVTPLLASMGVDRYTFDSTDEVGNLEDAVYMLTNLVALRIGWTLGWRLSGRLVSRPVPSRRFKGQRAADFAMAQQLYAMARGALGSGARKLVNVGLGRWQEMGLPWRIALSTSAAEQVRPALQTVALSILGLYGGISLTCRPLT
jgi:hypothetical protein